MKKYILCILLCSTYPLIAWSGGEAKGESPIFYGTLISREGNVSQVVNIRIGKTADSLETIKLYEMPKELKPEEKLILINPFQQLTTADLDLKNVQKIEVPNPDIIWTWKKEDTKRTSAQLYEFIQVDVTWKSNGKLSYLLELGLKGTSHPTKIFCDVSTKPETAHHNDVLVCKNVSKSEVRHKGAPFPAIKELVVDDFCLKLPTTENQKTE